MQRKTDSLTHWPTSCSETENPERLSGPTPSPDWVDAACFCTGCNLHMLPRLECVELYLHNFVWLRGLILNCAQRQVQYLYCLHQLRYCYCFRKIHNLKVRPFQISITLKCLSTGRAWFVTWERVYLRRWAFYTLLTECVNYYDVCFLPVLLCSFGSFFFVIVYMVVCFVCFCLIL